MNIVVGISVVDDDELIIEAIKHELSKEGNFQVEYYSDGKEFIERLTKDIDIAIIDYVLPYFDGLTILKEINKVNRNCYTIILSAQDEKDPIIEMLNEGAFKYVDKEKPNWNKKLKEFTHQAYERVLEKRKIIHELSTFNDREN
jgi:DNA-binding response OmpR family regulator